MLRLCCVVLARSGANDNTEGPNPGRILAMTSSDGVHFVPRDRRDVSMVTLDGASPPAKSETLFTQRDVDIRYDRVNKQLLMLQGDVGANQIFWSLSDDLGAPLTHSHHFHVQVFSSHMLRLRFRVDVASLGGHSHYRCPQRQRVQDLQ
jgi:hypothetical protein